MKGLAFSGLGRHGVQVLALHCVYNSVGRLTTGHKGVVPKQTCFVG